MTGIRLQQKFATRNRILVSARQQLQIAAFEDIGVREIGQGAGVAAGTVIAVFGCKANLLEALVIEDLDVQHRLALQAVEGKVGAAARLFAMLAVGIHYHVRQPALLQASMTAFWSASGAARVRLYRAVTPVIAMIEAEIEAGKASGELRPDLDSRMAALMVLECLLATHAMSCNGVRATEPMLRTLERRLTLLLGGLVSPSDAKRLAVAA